MICGIGGKLPTDKHKMRQKTPASLTLSLGSISSVLGHLCTLDHTLIDNQREYNTQRQLNQIAVWPIYICYQLYLCIHLFILLLFIMNLFIYS